jgi:hypothetical protein
LSLFLRSLKVRFLRNLRLEATCASNTEIDSVIKAPPTLFGNQ